MAQDYEMIGQVSPELEATLADRQGWQGQVAQPPDYEMTDPTDFSRRDAQSNLQALGAENGTFMSPESPVVMAGYEQTSMAAERGNPPAAGHE